MMVYPAVKELLEFIEVIRVLDTKKELLTLRPAGPEYSDIALIIECNTTGRYITLDVSGGFTAPLLVTLWYEGCMEGAYDVFNQMSVNTIYNTLTKNDEVEEDE